VVPSDLTRKGVDEEIEKEGKVLWNGFTLGETRRMWRTKKTRRMWRTKKTRRTRRTRRTKRTRSMQMTKVTFFKN